MSGSSGVAKLEQHARALEHEVTVRTHLERRMLTLLELTAQLAAATDRETIARLTVENGVRATSAADGAVWFLPPGTTQLELLASSHNVSPHEAAQTYRVMSITGDTPVAHAVRTGDAQFLGSLEQYAQRFPASRERLRPIFPTGEHAFAILPVALDERVLGCVVFTYDRVRAFNGPERAFKAVLARQCALALARVEQHEQERALRIAAEEATRAREEILSVVSHDLRNPLGTIFMGAASLLNTDDDRTRTIAERIHRQAERMARLIEDLVDFSGIQAGQVAIDCKPHKAEEILSATSDIFGTIARERGLSFEASWVPDLPPIRCDSERAVQVMSNLVANALKVTPRGGAIEIGAEPRSEGVVFYVRDTGPGIEAEELPQLFERYWRSKHAQYKGAGLGLSIARGIVDAHGGRIWAESQLGQGTTFYFSLAAQPNN